MRKRLRDIALNSLLVLLSLVAMLVVLEYVVFRHFVAVTDVPEVVFTNGIIRYVPNQRGTYRIASESAAAFRINEQGWPSRHARYQKDKGGKKRIAVIGDSYVAGLEVGTDSMLSSRLETLIGEEAVEVYTFGIGGAPLSQYLYVLRKEVLAYDPDVIVFVVVKNDLRDSYVFEAGSGRYGSSFPKWVVQDGAVVREVEPQAYHGQWRWLLRSALFRYFWYQRKLKGALVNYRQQYLRDPRDEAAYEASGLQARATPANHQAVITYFMKHLADYRQQGREVLVALNADVGGIQAGAAASAMEGYSTLFAALACESGVRFLDLHPVFATEYVRHGRRLNFEHDPHWNAYTHRLAAGAVARALRADVSESACRDGS